MASSYVFGIALLLGVSAGVYVLVRGVERADAQERIASVDELGRERPAGRIALTAPFVAATLSAFGLLGYAMVEWLGVGFGRSTLLAGLLAAGGGTGLAALMGRWARRATQLDAPDERFVLQGHVARVVASTTQAMDGAVEYEANGRRVVAAARSIDDSSLALGAEVVISHIEDGVVYVEPWSSVEERL